MSAYDQQSEHDRSAHDDRDVHAEHDGGAHGDHDAHAEHDGGAHGDHDAHAGHDAHGGHDHSGHDHGGHGDHVAMFRRMFWWMLALAVPVVLLDPMFASLLGYPLPGDGALGLLVAAIPPVLGTVMYVVGGRPFLSGGLSELRSRRPGMMLLIALAITVAFVASWLATFGVLARDLTFWWELALLVVIMLLGHWIEMGSLARTSSALDSLAALLPDEAERVTEDGGTETVPAGDLQLGDRVLVRPGGSIPADGRVIEGTAAVDESMITGESRAVRRSAGSEVVAGTVSTDSALRVEVTAIGEDTALAGIQGLVERAQGSSSRAQRLADRAASWLFWFALGAAVITAIVWLALGQPQAALTRVITVLVIACPHALGLAIPLVVSISTERAARAGILVKDRLALERMRTIDTVVFDKTGTLTRGEPEVTGILPANDPEAAEGGHAENSPSVERTHGADSLLALAAAAEAPSEHPLARAIVAAARERELDIPAARGFTSEPGRGVRAEVDGRRIAVGGPGLLAAHGAEALPAAGEGEADGDTVLHVLEDDRVLGALRLADGIRPVSRAAVEDLQARGIEVVMMTGDAEGVARTVAGSLGITQVQAGVRPEDKADHVTALQAEGRRVAMVGDGVNDAPALAAADVGIAIGAGTDVAIASAGVILAGDDPRSVTGVIDLSRAAFRKMVQNLWWAAGYNLLAVPLAAGVLAPIGFVMPMSVGALLMSASTVVVALNAQLLRRLDLRPDGHTAPRS